MGFRIPAGALTISIGADGNAEMNVTKVEVSLDFWDHWLEIARQHAIEAVSLHRKMIAAHGNGADQETSDLFGRVLRASITCMGALGFSLDALYSSIKERVPEDLYRSVGSDNTSRHEYVHETLKRSVRISNRQAKLQKEAIRQVFRFRDMAVHPSGGWAEPVLHPDIGVGVAEGYIRFGATNAVRGYAMTRRVTETVLSNVRPKYAELAEWAAGAVQRLPDQLPTDVVRIHWTDETEQ